MAVDFRCEKCGKLLSVDAQPSSRIKCPYCKAKVQVPAGLASLPRPLVPGAPAGAARPLVAASTVNAGVLEQPVYEQADPLMDLMARLMPWVISLFFHAAVLVIFAFLTIVVMRTAPQVEENTVELPFSQAPGSPLKAPGYGNPELAPRSLDQSGTQDGWAKYRSAIPAVGVGLGVEGSAEGSGNTQNAVNVIGYAGGGGVGGGGGTPAPFGLVGGGGGGGGRKVRIFNSESKIPVFNVVYVVDRSGSMYDTFEDVRKEMRNSIALLGDDQTFHVIFFADGPPKENPPRRLVLADKTAKLEAAKYLRDITPQGQTDPIPALKRAFEVLAAAPNKKGKLIFLLTDGDFSKNDEVVQTIKALNADGSVHINTILHRFKIETAMKVLQKIADENGGTFKFVEVTE